ncbi:Expressed protein precursor [hydrothermal vent metagenome]|uniref:Expressed protein n=1 Tax=hydrothermal vent metagenome TaxID=652676 RepID=A0A3B1BAD4_9ZZZZ
MIKDKNHFQLKMGLLSLISAIVIIGVFLIPAMKQDLSYHQFSDQRFLLGIPNLLNVISNLAFFIIGLFGLIYLKTDKNAAVLASIRFNYSVFYFGVLLVALGSGYYHLTPTNSSLVWDRLPMTVAFMAFFSIIISEFISEKLGELVFIPLIIIGLLSIWYWNYTEQNNIGDLRLYVLVQFLPMLLIPLIMLMFQSCFSHAKLYWYFLAMYGLAKIAETYDAAIYDYFQFISGHSIKHILASFGCIIFYIQVKKRYLIKGKS